VGAVVVSTNDDARILRAVIDALMAGDAVPRRVALVDNNSRDTSVHEEAEQTYRGVELVRQSDNVGFCAANNAGIRVVDDCRYVLILNPDAVVTPTFLGAAVAFMDDHPDVGAMNPKLLGLDGATLQPTGLIDAVGIFWTWYGKSYDRGQGVHDEGQYDGMATDVPALCAAAMLCRRDALLDLDDASGIFDESFFVFKDDLDLSLRLRKRGWRTMLVPSTVVYHCRQNKQSRRASVPPWVRKMSIRNEWKLWRKGTLPVRTRVPMLVYLTVKSALVRVGR
jgi:GT2 family glycosyltransferase